MLAHGAARVADNGFLYALTDFERDRDGLEGETVCTAGAGRRGHRVDGVLLGILLGAAGARFVHPVTHCVKAQCEGTA